MSALVSDLQELLGENVVLTGDSISERYTKSWGGHSMHKPLAVVRPGSTEEISALLKICYQTETPVVAQGGMTGLVHGGAPESNGIVLSLERLNQIEEIDEAGRTMTVQAGVALQQAQESAEGLDLSVPVDLSARGSATIGGNISTNAGGIRVVRYGMMRETVLGLEAVLADGTIISGMNKMLKNNSGYDLKQLFIGSEGTLGIVTRAVLRLRTNPKHYASGYIGINGFDNLTRFLNHMDKSLSGNLGAFEVMWNRYVSFILQHKPKYQCPIPRDHEYHVIAEGIDVADEQFIEALEQALDQELIDDAAVAQSEQDRQDFWQVREEAGEAVQTLAPLFSYDVSMPIKSMGHFSERLHQSMDQTYPGHGTYIFGHMADGNLHVLVKAGNGSEQDHREVNNLLYDIIRDLQGSVSAEHGIGLEKKAYLSWCRSTEEIELMRALKQTLDPKGILNPGKIL